MIFYYFILLIYLIVNPVFSTDATQQDTATQGFQQSGYKIEQPGTITFTVGVKIKGKVEKPQVMIFLPKEKTEYKKDILDHSFSEDLSEPLPYIPIIE